MYKITKLDLKVIGAVKWAVPIQDFLVFIICLALFPRFQGAWLSIELIFPYSAVWWGIFFMGELWQRSSFTEMLIACNRELHRILTVKYWSFLMAFAFAHTLFAAIICLPVDAGGGILFLPLLFLECLAFGGIGFFLMALLRDAGWTIMLLLCIFIGDYGTQGKLFGNFHFSLYWYEDLSIAVIRSRYLCAGCLAMIFFLCGYRLLKHFCLYEKRI